MDDLMAADARIRQLHARYADAVWRKDPASFGALFANDGEWKVAGLHMKGQVEIEATFARFHGSRPTNADALCDADCNDCLGWSVEPHLYDRKQSLRRRPHSEHDRIYYECFVEEGGDWRFTWRHWNLHYIGAPVFSSAL